MTTADSVEKEIKVLGIDCAVLCAKIESIGGRKVLDCLTTMDWYDSAGLDLQEPINCYDKGLPVIREAVNIYSRNKVLFRESGVFFRLRKEGSAYDFTLKYKLSDDEGIAQNREVSVSLQESDISRVTKDLSKVGFLCIARHQKIRTSYVLERGNKVVRFDIDRWPGIPAYLEIEAEERGSIFHALDQLELQNHELSTEVGDELFKRYGVSFYSDLKFS